MTGTLSIYSTALAACPIRAKPEDSSEMVSQLLFGEQVEVTRIYKSNWVEVKVIHDGYRGWMDPKQLVASHVDRSNLAVCLDLVEPVFADKMSTIITLGATLPVYDGMTFLLGSTKYRYSGQAQQVASITPSAELAQRLARKFINTPYLWGGRSPLGIDCSGLTQVVFKCCGIALLRDAIDQATQGETVDFVNSSKTGDLAFFTKSSDRITHVGIIIDDQKIIHAAGQVRIDSIDHYGIFNKDIQEYTHRLKIIKRFL